MEDSPHHLTHPTWERYTVLAHVIDQLPVRERRRIFLSCRTDEDDLHTLFFPIHGFTFSEFAVWHTLGERKRAKKNEK